MTKKPFKGNYLTLENVRVHYDPNNDSIHLTSKDKDIIKGENFHLTLNNGKEAEGILRRILEENNMMPEGYLRAVPQVAYRENRDGVNLWNEIPLGIGRGGKEIIWDVTTEPSLLMGGSTGSGKSKIIKLIFDHCLEYPKDWGIVAVDLRQVEFSPYVNEPNVINVSHTKSNAGAAIQAIHDTMLHRYSLMEQLNLTNFRRLPDEPRALMVVIDEAALVLSETGQKTVEGRHDSYLTKKIRHLLTDIARLGRAAGVHLTIVTQRVDANIFEGEFKQNLPLKISVGRSDKLASYMLLGNEKGSFIPPVLGRGYIQKGVDGEECQFYFSPYAPSASTQGVLPSELSLVKQMIAINEAKLELRLRNENMKAESVSDYKALRHPPKVITVSIDDWSHIPSETFKGGGISIEELLTAGRSVGIEIVIGKQ